MSAMKTNSILTFVFLLMASGMPAAAKASQSGRNILLKNGWLIQSSAVARQRGAAISGLTFQPRNWYKATVPSTVLGTLVSDGVFKHPFYGLNLRKIPDSLFTAPWWYRTTFEMPPKTKTANHATLKFLGIIYRANIWLNGRLIASSDSTVGTFRQFQFDVTKDVRFGGKNVLAVEIYRPGPGALTLGFVDWSPEPPDRDMGLWRPVKIHISGDVSMEYPFVATKVDTATLKKAWLTVSTQLTNNLDRRVAGTLEGNIGRITFSKRVSLSPHEKRIVAFSPETFRQLIIKDPRLWWTNDFGKPSLYSVHLRFMVDRSTTDHADTKFGIRQINDYINREGFRGFMLNGKKILVRGGGWADQLFLQQNERNLRAQIDYAVNMHLNAIRMEGFWGENSDIYNLCDEKGILIMEGVSCQWEWEEYFGKPTGQYGGVVSSADMGIAARSFKDQVKWLRNHPSIFVWLYGSDLLPRATLEKMYLRILSKYDTTRPHLASAKEHTSALSGPTAVKMRGPYDYVPPVYWYTDTAHGGAFGFNTETGPGPQIPRVGSLVKMLSPDSLWPINSEWHFHSPLRTFSKFGMYNAAIDRRLGPPASLNDYEREAQYTNYEAMRGMFEAFGANKFKSTGVIQWMYNASWPRMWWQLYDYYLNPTGAFYGAEKACEPIHIQYDYGDGAIVVVNSTLKPSDGLTLKARAFDFNMKEIYKFEKKIDISANSSSRITALPALNSPTLTYFLDLGLYHGSNLISVNFYALSTSPDVIHETKAAWHIPENTYANLTELKELPEVKLDVHWQFERRGNKYFVRARLNNPTKHLAFMVYVSIKSVIKKPLVNSGMAEGSKDDEFTVLPIFWNDNYISLLPGGTRTLKGHFYARDLKDGSPRLEVSGWNIEKKDY